jgi:hypothetical protein
MIKEGTAACSTDEPTGHSGRDSRWQNIELPMASPQCINERRRYSDTVTSTQSRLSRSEHDLVICA